MKTKLNTESCKIKYLILSLAILILFTNNSGSTFYQYSFVGSDYNAPHHLKLF